MRVGQVRSFKGRQFTAEVILWAMRWYLMFPISYRDLELMLLDRGVSVDHTTIFRWIQAYAAELEKRIRPHLRMSNDSATVLSALAPASMSRSEVQLSPGYAASRMASTVTVRRRNCNRGRRWLRSSSCPRQNRAADLGHLKPRMGRYRPFRPR